MVVALGHSDATAEQVDVAVAAGARYVTHLFNGMAPFGHRAPGVVGAALAGDVVVCGLIADGLHVDPTAVRAAWRALGPTRLDLVSDAVAAAGAPPGAARLGGVDVVAGPAGVRTAGGVLAGSTLALDAAVRNLVSWTGCEPHEAIATVTATPAALLGLTGKGRVEAGADADLVLLTGALEVVATIVAGAVVHSTEPAWRS